MFVEFLRGVGRRTRNSVLHFGSDLHSDLDLEILFLLNLFPVCKIVLLYYCLLGVITITLMVLL